MQQIQFGPAPAEDCHSGTYAVLLRCCCADKHISLVFSRSFPLKCSHVPQVKNGDYVGVSLSGVTNATTYDAVAIYVQDPSGDAVGLTKLLKYKWANEDLTYVTTGKTSFRYRSLSWNATHRREEKGRPCRISTALEFAYMLTGNVTQWRCPCAA